MTRAPFSRREFLASAAAVGWLATRASAQRKSRRRDGGPVIDAHAHWFPIEFLQTLEADGAASGAKVTHKGDSWGIESDWVTANAINAEHFDLAARIRMMDQEGVDIEALSLTNPMVHWATPQYGLKLARVYNDATSKAHSDHPQRFVGLATLPVQAPDLALAELERAATLPGMRGLYLPTTVHGKELDDPAFFPLYAACERLGWPIGLHPIETIGRDRTGQFYLRNLLGNPYDTGVAAAHLIFGGVLDRFPMLEIILPHAGGTFPALVGRFDRGVAVRPELKHMQKPATAYLRRFTYDTITHNDELLVNLIHLVGADRVVLGSDYPYDMGYPHPAAVVERLTSLSAKDRDQVLGGNAARLLRITA